jgi:hypothetical protein
MNRKCMNRTLRVDDGASVLKEQSPTVRKLKVSNAYQGGAQQLPNG